MNDNIIVYPPCETLGDTFSIIGLIIFFLEHYNKVYFVISTNKVNEYYSKFFFNFNYLNVRLFIINNTSKLMRSSKYNEFHVCNLITGSWKSDNKFFNANYLYNHPKINNNFYFTYLNPINNKLIIDKKYLTVPNVKLPLQEVEVNHIVYYKLIGLNNSVRLDYFNYIRNMKNEKLVMQQILKKYNLKSDEKYNIIYYCDHAEYSKENSVINCNNNYKNIPIDNLIDFLGRLFLLIENAEEIHLAEGFNSIFIYMCNFKKIINLPQKVKLYTKRRHDGKNPYRINLEYGLDYFWKMYDNPKLDNWDFIF